MMGVDEPDYGHLLQEMFFEDGDTVDASAYCSPRVEVEVGFVLADRLEGPDCTEDDVIGATDYVVPCIELIDSRIRDWEIKLPDTIADNASSAGVIPGPTRTRLEDIDVRVLQVTLQKNGVIVETAVSGAVLGNPVTAVAWLANKLHTFGVALEPGHLVLPGSSTRAVDVRPGDVIRAETETLGVVSVSFK
jgi:2-keto-4-pentenoate hydratase